MPDEYWLWLQLDEFDATTEDAEDIGDPVLYRVFPQLEIAKAMTAALTESEKSTTRLGQFSHGFVSEDPGFGLPLAEHVDMPYRIWAMTQVARQDGSFEFLRDTVALVAAYESVEAAQAALARITDEGEASRTDETCPLCDATLVNAGGGCASCGAAPCGECETWSAATARFCPGCGGKFAESDADAGSDATGQSHESTVTANVGMPPGDDRRSPSFVTIQAYGILSKTSGVPIVQLGSNGATATFERFCQAALAVFSLAAPLAWIHRNQMDAFVECYLPARPVRKALTEMLELGRRAAATMPEGDDIVSAVLGGMAYETGVRRTTQEVLQIFSASRDSLIAMEGAASRLVDIGTWAAGFGVLFPERLVAILQSGNPSVDLSAKARSSSDAFLSFCRAEYPHVVGALERGSTDGGWLSRQAASIGAADRDHFNSIREVMRSELNELERIEPGYLSRLQAQGKLVTTMCGRLGAALRIKEPDSADVLLMKGYLLELAQAGADWQHEYELHVRMRSNLHPDWPPAPSLDKVSPLIHGRLSELEEAGVLEFLDDWAPTSGDHGTQCDRRHTNRQRCNANGHRSGAA